MNTIMPGLHSSLPTQEFLHGGRCRLIQRFLFFLVACVLLQSAKADQSTDLEWAAAAFDDAAAAARRGEYPLAVERFEAILKKNPKAKEAYKRLSWILATCPDAALRDGKRAVDLAEKCGKLPDEVFPDGQGGWKVRVYFGTGVPWEPEVLAAAHAEAGHFGKAVLLQKKILKDYKKQGHPKPGLADPVKPAEERLALYEANKAFHTNR